MNENTSCRTLFDSVKFPVDFGLTKINRSCNTLNDILVENLEFQFLDPTKTKMLMAHYMRITFIELVIVNDCKNI